MNIGFHVKYFSRVIYMYKYKSAIYMKIDICLVRLIYTNKEYSNSVVSQRKTSHVT